MKKFEICEEMNILREYLSGHHIDWVDASSREEEYWMCRTRFIYKGAGWSVIHGFGSYGGFSHVGKDRGLLELMSNKVDEGEPVGFLKAADIIKYIEEA